MQCLLHSSAEPSADSLIPSNQSTTFSQTFISWHLVSESENIEVPYELPEGWKWCRLGDFFAHTTGKALKKENTVGTLKKYITTSNIYWDYFDFSDVREMYFADSELEKCTATKGDLLICNGVDVGRGAIWNFDYDICLQNHVSRLRKKTNNVSTEYFYPE